MIPLRISLTVIGYVRKTISASSTQADQYSSSSSSCTL